MSLLTRIQTAAKLFQAATSRTATGGAPSAILRTVIVLILLLSAGCSDDGPGHFFWAVSNDRAFDTIEQKNFTASVYHKTKRTPRFKSGERIWWVYRPDTAMFSGSEFLVIVSKKTFGWVELNSRLMQPDHDAILRNSFVLNEPGCYQVEIIKEGRILSSNAFAVETPPSPYMVNLDLDDPETDEIIRYSRNTGSLSHCR